VNRARGFAHRRGGRSRRHARSLDGEGKRLPDREPKRVDAYRRWLPAAVFEAIRGLGHGSDELKHLIFTHGHPEGVWEG
jgi:hypothetical protein